MTKLKTANLKKAKIYDLAFSDNNFEKTIRNLVKNDMLYYLQSSYYH
jgi:hypothetical protein